MTQESWKYLINGSYVMLASLFMPITYLPLSACGIYIVHNFYWIFGLFISVDGVVYIRWFFELTVFFWLLPLISIIFIVGGSILIIISARKVKQGKKVNRGIFTLVIYLQIAILLVNLFFYFIIGMIIPFFGCLSFLFGLILLNIGNKKFL